MPLLETAVAFLAIPFLWGLFCQAATLMGVNTVAAAVLAGAVSLSAAVVICRSTVADQSRPGARAALRSAALVAVATVIPVLVVVQLGTLGFALSVLGIVALVAATFGPMVLPGRYGARQPARDVA